MKKFLFKVFLFFVLVVIMDNAFGYLFSLLRFYAKGGSTAKCEYIANQSQDDIIILGSSRATHHYVPSIIKDSLGLSCYNCGEEGNGIVLAYGRYKQITSRYKPKLVVYEVTPGYDYSYLEVDTKYIGYLKPYYEQPFIKPIVDDFGGNLIGIKMLSKMFQNSGRLIPNIVDNVICRDNKDGYVPLWGIKHTAIHNQSATKNKHWDIHKLSYLEKLIVDTKRDKIPLLLVVSPKCEFGDDIMQLLPAINLCKKYGVPFLNMKNCKGISDTPKLFQDDYHLNDSGAKAFTSLFVKEIRKTLN